MEHSTRTAMDKEEQKKKKSREERSKKSSRKSKKKKKKSAEASLKISKKSKKAKKSEKKVKKFEVRQMDDDLNSTQRSAKSDPKGPPPLQVNVNSTKTPKTAPVGAKSVPVVSAQPNNLAMNPISPVKSLVPAPPPPPCATPIVLEKTSPRSAPAGLPNSLESKGIKSMPAF